MAFVAYSATAPVEHPAVTKQRLRAKLCRIIDRLVTALDDIDGDPDLELGTDDEPSLCGVHMNLAAIALDDCEEEADSEPSLCGVTFGGSMPVSAGPYGLQWDAEEQCDDEGHDSDREAEDH